MLEMKLKKVGLICSKTCYAQEMWDILNHHLEMYCAYSSRIRVFQFHGWTQSHLQFFFHSCAKTENYFTWCIFTDERLPPLQFWRCMLEVSFSETVQTNFVHHKRESAIHSHSHVETRVCGPVDHIMIRITSRARSTQLYIFDDTSFVIHMISKEHVTRNHRGGLCGWAWVILFLTNTCERYTVEDDVSSGDANDERRTQPEMERSKK